MDRQFSDKLVDRRTALKSLASAGAGLIAFSGAVPAAAANGPAREQSPADLPGLTAAPQGKLQVLLGSGRFSGQIPADLVRELAKSEQKTADEIMLALLPLAQSYSRPPISDFHVGAVARGASGSLYLGFNIEIPGQMLGFAVHGEQAALSSAYMHGEERVEAIGIKGGAPCGHCRQFMNEFSPDGEIAVVIQGMPPMKLQALLPMPFGPKALGRTEGAVPVRETRLAAAVPASDDVAQAALDAARKSYSPYSGSHSGVAILTRSGRVFSGSYIENVAFNPSLSPLQTALVQMIVAGEDYTAITRVVLVEANGAKISQKAVAESVLRALAPSVALERVLAEA